MLPSIVSNTSKRFSASASSVPFLNPAQPMSGTDSTVWPGKSRRNRQSRFSSRRILTSGRGQQLLAKLFQHGNHLLPPHAGESFQKIVDRIPGLQVIEKALYRHARADEDRRPAQNLRVGMDDAFTFHGRSLPQGPSRFKLSIWIRAN